jgi:hypothetical protein
LQDRAASYRGIAASSSAAEVRWDSSKRIRRSCRASRCTKHADIDSIWEAVECSTLICFRDALDAELPHDVGAIVRRGISDGVSALERLRSLPREE